jgi:hypothetical protein
VVEGVGWRPFCPWLVGPGVEAEAVAVEVAEVVEVEAGVAMVLPPLRRPAERAARHPPEQVVGAVVAVVAVPRAAVVPVPVALVLALAVAAAAVVVAVAVAVGVGKRPQRLWRP